MNDNSKAILALFAGLAAGAALGILLAPEKGSDTRTKINDSLNELGNELREKVNSSLQNVRGKADELAEKAGELAGKARNKANEAARMESGRASCRERVCEQV